MHEAREKMVDAAVSQQQAGGGMSLSEHFLRESHALITALGPGEGQVLSRGEIPRVGRSYLINTFKPLRA
jgi:hypothetical protein